LGIAIFRTGRPRSRPGDIGHGEVVGGLIFIPGPPQPVELGAQAAVVAATHREEGQFGFGNLGTGRNRVQIEAE
jgi:hypothetical protein